ncbi:hypothetical protein AB0D49_08295 [Streptomyces sp. NPDC048290]|uniref:hypothetical protein n=1 Tax=Streptomyces sp. NPDC048290 TaxID=3155811 RepID=UPI003441724B
MRRRLALWAARTTTADRLGRGSSIVWQTRADAVTAWVRAGRRTDLTGWRAALGPLVRLALLGVLAYTVWAVLRALPWLMWLVVGWWLRAAWRAGRPSTSAAEEPAEGALLPASGETIRQLLDILIGADSAVHLSTVLDHLRKRPDTAALTASWTVTDLRACLEGLSIPVHLKVKAGGKGPTRGVRRVDLAPAPAAAPRPGESPSTAA